VDPLPSMPMLYVKKLKIETSIYIGIYSPGLPYKFFRGLKCHYLDHRHLAFLCRPLYGASFILGGPLRGGANFSV